MDTSNSSGDRDGSEEQSRHLAKQLKHIKDVILKAMFIHKYSWPFREPVDTVGLNLTDYHNIIKKPMDMGSIKKKLEAGEYTSAQQCIDDFQLMFDNCYLYNQPGDEVVIMCKEIEQIFRKKIAGMPKDDPARSGRGRGRTPRPSSNGSISGSDPSTISISGSDPPAVSISGSDPPAVSPAPMPKESAKPKVTSNNSLVAAVLPTPKVTAAAPLPPSFPSLPTVSQLASNPVSVSPAVAVSMARESALTTYTQSLTTSSSKPKKGVKRKAEASASPARPVALEAVMAGRSGDAATSERRETVSRPPKRAKKETMDYVKLPSSSNKTNNLDRPRSESLKYCQNLFKDILKEPHLEWALPFWKQADVTAPGSEKHLQSIIQPMGCEKVKEKLETHRYRTSDEFARDMRDIFTNTYRFYEKDSDMLLRARKLHDYFDVNIAHVPDGPFEPLDPSLPPLSIPMDTSDNDRSNSGSESSSSENDKFRKKEREDKLRSLQNQLTKLQEEITRMTASKSSHKKTKKKKVPTATLR